MQLNDAENKVANIIIYKTLELKVQVNQQVTPTMTRTILKKIPRKKQSKRPQENTPSSDYVKRYNAKKKGIIQN